MKKYKMINKIYKNKRGVYMVTASNIGSGKKVNVGQSFASGMSALQTTQKEKFVIVDESGTKKDAERFYGAACHCGALQYF